MKNSKFNKFKTKSIIDSTIIGGRIECDNSDTVGLDKSADYTQYSTPCDCQDVFLSVPPRQDSYTSPFHQSSFYF